MCHFLQATLDQSFSVLGRRHGDALAVREVLRPPFRDLTVEGRFGVSRDSGTDALAMLNRYCLIAHFDTRAVLMSRGILTEAGHFLVSTFLAAISARCEWARAGIWIASEIGSTRLPPLTEQVLEIHDVGTPVVLASNALMVTSGYSAR